jgi:formamidopyrimidine-DNA glycosylase
MPELPEVETVCRGLASSVIGCSFTNVKLQRPNLRIAFPVGFSEIVTGQKIINVTRRAKYIQLHLAQHVIIMHLGMSGRLVVYDKPREQMQKHDHAIFMLDDGKEMVFNDARRFGLITICANNLLANHKLFATLGPEPLEDGFSADYLYNELRHKKTSIKQVLMNNVIVVGVGNIYACESLFQAGISPVRAANMVSKEEIARLVPIIQQVLVEAIKAGGSTLSDYVNSSGNAGYFQHQFLVYDKAGKPCSKCGGLIIRIKQGGRSSFYCGNCQL